MKSLSRILLKVITGYHTRFGTKYPVYDRVSVSRNSVKHYGGTLGRMAQLKGSEHTLLLYLAEIMDHENKVENDSRTRNDFISYMAKNQVQYKEEYVKLMFKALSKTEFLKPEGKRGSYYVNPHYFYRGNKGRFELIKKLYENQILKKL